MQDWLCRVAGLHRLRRMKLRFLFLCVAALFLASSSNSFATETGATKPVFLYPRYFNAPGENRYLPDGNYKDVPRTRMPGAKRCRNTRR